MKKTTLSLIVLLISLSLFSQQRIDGTFSFQIDPAKKYSIYIPSSYNAATPNKMMLGLHPFNTSRWNAISWCDTLINFAEANNLILVCPDGGIDGKIDDAIDTAFTSALLDSAQIWYNIDTEKTYVMGFSWGGKTTYTYGLNRPTVFGGYLPIGAAISGTSEVNALLQQNSTGKPVYIIHGSTDNPNARFYSVRDSLIAKGAHVKTNLLAGVGHTIDFANRDAILDAGFHYIDSINCYQPTTAMESISSPPSGMKFFPNPLTKGSVLKLMVAQDIQSQQAEIIVYDVTGKKLNAIQQQISTGINTISSQFINFKPGTYFISTQIITEQTNTTQKIIIR